MENIVHFDVAAVIMMIVIFCSNITRKYSKGTTNRIFQLLIVVTLLSALFNAVSAGLENYNVASDEVLQAFRILYMLLHNFATPIYVTYIISLTRTWHKFIGHPVLSLLLVIPYFAELVLLVSNPFTHFFFTYTNGVLKKENTITILYITASFYLLFGVFYLIYHRHLFSKSKLIILLSSIPLMLLAILLKFFFPNSLVEIFSNAVSLMIISMTIQNPDKNIDSVTGALKYVAYGEAMKMDYSNKKNHKIIFVNIINFNSIGRLLGFEGTNIFLRQVAEYLMIHNRKHKARAEIFYLDRGRFRVVVNSFNLKKAEELAKAINDSSKLPVKVNHIDINAEAVVCIADCPKDLKDFKSLIAFGNDYHERVEHTGELLYASDLFEKREFRIMNEMADILERGFENNSFQVYYQPIYSVDKKRFVSAEALTRLVDEEYGFIPPNLFIPVAEKNGDIHRIGDIVLEDVCRFIASDTFKELNLDYIEINLSVVQCMQFGLADHILETINKYGISPSKINLEITETAANYNQTAMIDNMTKLIDAGISFSLDDFGTGYSNMARVASLPLKIVKLDKTFVDNSNKPRLHIFLKGTIKMLKDMDMEIVVEGIETEQMVEMFSELNCDYIQGYFYSKPVPEKEFVCFIRNALLTA
ncbi:MAG: EAL domain-containing protein [Ruminiclostridium sp.]|nr:EAL domain-containing protein [Ruminiclostridium sp.]